MTRFFIAFIFLVVGLYGSSNAQELPSAHELLDRSLTYHDAQGAWYEKDHSIHLLSKRPSGNDRQTTILLNHSEGLFGMEMVRDGLDIKTSTTDGSCEATVDGSGTYSKEQEEKYRLHCEGIMRWRDYHGYMLGLPMKLNDPGTILDPTARMETFMDKEAISLKVTYEEEVGADTWYFYLDPTTYALIGTRFYHDESKNDGEYIIFEGEIEYGGIRLPKVRKWYYNNNAEFLGEDVITKFGS